VKKVVDLKESWCQRRRRRKATAKARSRILQEKQQRQKFGNPVKEIMMAREIAHPLGCTKRLWNRDYWQASRAH
jgi:hypothetical protein